MTSSSTRIQFGGCLWSGGFGPHKDIYGCLMWYLVFDLFDHRKCEEKRSFIALVGEDSFLAGYRLYLGYQWENLASYYDPKLQNWIDRSQWTTKNSSKSVRHAPVVILSLFFKLQMKKFNKSTVCLFNFNNHIMCLMPTHQSIYMLLCIQIIHYLHFINETTAFCRSKFVKKRVTIGTAEQYLSLHTIQIIVSEQNTHTKYRDDLDFVCCSIQIVLYTLKSPFIKHPYWAKCTVYCTEYITAAAMLCYICCTAPDSIHNLLSESILLKKTFSILMNEKFCNLCTKCQYTQKKKRIWLIISQWLFYWRILYSKIELNKSTIGHQLNLQHIFFW